jgi:integrase
MSVDEVICCYQVAIGNEDYQLSDLIMIGAYTGLRISEICHLEIDDINLRQSFLKVKDSKNQSGKREVPIHQELKPRIRKLINQSQDGFIISGLTFNKYRKRSDAIGKRFGRLKNSLGFSDRHVFHSTRKTVGTTLENANVKENIASDILGHKKERITYKIYSGGANMKIKKESMKGIHYDWNKKVKSPKQIKEEKEKRETVRNAKSKTTKP